MVLRFFIVILLSKKLVGQTTSLEKVYFDCDKARELTITTSTVIGKTAAPNGPGSYNEISKEKSKNSNVFVKEHNSAWYKLKMAASGKLIFDIIPTKPSDDYDFILYRAFSYGSCDSINYYGKTPVRSCISRDKSDLKGRTGLKLDAQKEFIEAGLNDAYAKYIEVKKGEIYYLALDNVYKNGDGHTIRFGIAEQMKVEGKILDENNTPVDAEITVTDQYGDTMFLKKTGKEGQYMFLVPVRQDVKYNLNFYNPKSFFYSQNFKASDSNELKHLSVVLPKLKKARKHSVGSLNFVPGETYFLPQSIPSVNNLYKLMIANPNLKIMIIGHSNGRDVQEEKAAIEFTRKRSEAIKDFLVKKGIEEKRIQVDGKADHEMLFPIEIATERQQEMNRRVEVYVIEY